LVEPIVDTTLLIELFRGNPDAQTYLLGRLESGRLPLHAAVLAELFEGCKNKAEIRHLEGLLRKAKLIHPSPSDWTLALRLVRTYRASHGVDWVDCLIAATAVRLKAPVATLNEKHFRPLPGVQVVRPF
jgi:predicted nucleic acid-binding protein